MSQILNYPQVKGAPGGAQGSIKLFNSANTHAVTLEAQASLASDVTMTLPVVRVIGLPIVSASGALAAGATSFAVTVPFACAIIGWSISLGPTDSGTVTVKVWKIATGSALPTSANSISSSGVSLSSGSAIQSGTVSDFTTPAIAANDQLVAELSNVTGTVGTVIFQLSAQ